MSITSARSQMLSSALWGAFAVLAAIGSLAGHRAVSLICWSLALAVSFALVKLSKKSTNSAQHPHPGPTNSDAA